MFTPAYQIRLIALLVSDKELATKVLPFLTEDIFSSFVTKNLYQILSNYYLTYKDLPTLTVFNNEVAALDSVLPEEQPLFNEFQSIITVGTIPEKEYIKSTIKQFIQSRQLKIALNKHSEYIDKGDYDNLIQLLRQDKTELGFMDEQGPPKIFDLNNLQEIYAQRNGMKTGFPIIDESIGGLPPKELTFLLADTNVGKSLCLCAIGGHLVKNMHRVLHVTLEMSVARTLIRYLANMSDPEDNITYNNIHGFDPPEHVFNYVQKLHQRYESYFFLEEMPTGKGTVPHIYNMYEKYKPLDAIIVDYLDLLAPLKKRDNRRFELAEISVALRGLAVETNTAVLTATQTSRAAAGKRFITKELVAEDYEKMRVADTVIGLGQNSVDAQRHEVVFNITKSRNSEKDKAERYFIDYSTMKFRQLRRELVVSSDDER